MAEGRVKKLDAEGQDSKLQRASEKREFCELDVESAGF